MAADAGGGARQTASTGSGSGPAPPRATAQRRSRPGSARPPRAKGGRMPGFLRHVFSSEGFMPHGHCFLWRPGLIWLHVSADVLIGLSYVAISLTLAYLVHRARRDIPFHWMLLAFGTFIIACGATHFMEVWTLWVPVYWFAGDVKLLTAAASVATAVVLPALVPRALALIETAKTSEDRKAKLEVAHLELAGVYERLKELDTLKTQFFANVSHELRTPLALIVGPTEKLLAAGGLDDRQRHDLEVVGRNARTLLKHVNDLLDVAKLEAGKMAPSYARGDLARLVRLVAGHFDGLGEERRIGFSVEAPDAVAWPSPAGAPRSTWRTPAPAFRRSCARWSSTASGRRKAARRARSVARGSGSPSRRSSPSCTAGRSRWTTPPAEARASPSPCRWWRQPASRCGARPRRSTRAPSRSPDRRSRSSARASRRWRVLRKWAGRASSSSKTTPR